MATLIDRFARRKLDAFDQALERGENLVSESQLLSELLDTPLVFVDSVHTGSTDKIRGIACHGEELLLGGYDGVIRLFSLRVVRNKLKGQVWSRQAPGRVIACTFAKRSGANVAVACSETGQIDVGKLDDTEWRSCSLSHNIIKVAVCPSKPTLFAVCSFTGKTVALCSSEPEIVAESPTRYHPRQCFWRFVDKQCQLSVISQEGYIECFCLVDGRLEKVHDPVPLTMQKGVYDATVLSDDEDRLLVACSTPPEQPCYCLAVSDERASVIWRHADRERCYALTHLPSCDDAEEDCLVIGGKDGSLWCYSHEGSLRQCVELSEGTRAMQPIHPHRGNAGLVVALSDGTLAVYWCPPNRSLRRRVRETLDVDEVQSLARAATPPVLGLLGNTVGENFLLRCLETNFPAIIGMFQDWLREASHGPTPEEFWPLLMTFLRHRDPPLNSRLLAAQLLDAVRPHLRRDQVMDLNPLWMDVVSEHRKPIEVGLFGRAIAAHEHGDFALSLQLLSQLEDTALLEKEFFWEPILDEEYHVYITDVFADESGGRHAAPIAAIMANDGMLQRIEIGKTTQYTSLGGELTLECKDLHTAAGFANARTVSVLGNVVLVVSDEGCVSLFGKGEPRIFPEAFPSCVPLCAMLTPDHILVGTADGQILRANVPSITESLVCREPIKMGATKPIWRVLEGSFVEPDEKLIAVFQNGSGLRLVRHDGSPVADCQDAWSHVDEAAVADWYGDGRDEIIYRQRERIGRVRWSDESGRLEHSVLKVPDVTTMCVVRDARTTKMVVVVGTIDGEVYAISREGHELWLGDQDLGPLTAIGAFEHDGQPVLVTASRTRLVLWRRVVSEDVFRLRSACESQASGAESSDKRADNPYDDALLPANYLSAEVKALHKNINSDDGRVLVLRGVPGSGKAAVLKAACVKWWDADPGSRLLVNVKLRPEDGTSQSALGKRIARAVTDRASFGLQKAVRARALAEGTPGRLQEMFDQLRSAYRGRQVGETHERTTPQTTGPDIVVVFDEESPDGALLEDLVAGGHIGSYYYERLTDWAARYSPEIAFLIVVESEKNSIVEAIAAEKLTDHFIPPLIGERPARAMIETPAAGDLIFGKAATAAILRFSGRRPTILAAVCRRIWETKRVSAGRYVSEGDVWRAIEAVSEQEVRPWLTRVWTLYSPRQQVLLALAGHLESEHSLVEPSRVESVSVLAERLFETKDLEKTLDGFVKEGVLRRCENGYRFEFDALLRWIRRQGGAHSIILRNLRLDIDKLPLRLDQLFELNNELAKEGQLEDALAILELDLSEWQRMVEMSKCYGEMATFKPSDADLAAHFLEDFLEHTLGLARTPIDGRSADGSAWAPVSLPGPLKDERPTVAIAVPRRVLSVRDGGDAHRAVVRAFRECQAMAEAPEAKGLLPPRDVLVLQATLDDREIEQVYGNLPAYVGACVLGHDDLRRIIFDADPASALRDVLMGRPHGVKMVNPYQWEGPVMRPGMIRPRDGSTVGFPLADELCDSERQYSICGTRRIGKTTLLLLIRKLLSNDPTHRAAYCSFETLVGESERTIAHKAWKLLSEAVHRDMGSWAPAEHLVGQELILAWADRLKENNNRRVTLLLDEFGPVAASKACLSFIGALRAVPAATEYRVRSILCGWRDVFNAKNDNTHPLYNFGDRRDLPSLSMDEASDLIIDPMAQCGITYWDQKEAVQHITKQASTHPSFLQCFLHHLFKHVQGRKKIVPEDIGAVVEADQFREQVEATARENYDGLALFVLVVMAKKEKLREEHLVTILRDRLGSLFREYDLRRSLDLLRAGTVVSGIDDIEYTFPAALSDRQTVRLETIAKRQLQGAYD